LVAVCGHQCETHLGFYEKQGEIGPLDLSIIVVNHNGKDLLQRCLGSIYSREVVLAIETIVVDNGSTDGSRDMLTTQFPQVHRIYNNENRGFAAANNQGLSIATGSHVLLLNSDTEIVADALECAVNSLANTPHAGILGCQLRFPDGRLQRSARSFPNLWNLFCESTFLYLLFPRSKLFGEYYLTDFDYAQPSRVDWVSGAFFLIDRKVVNVIGLLDEQFFMYSEEMDYCLRAKMKGIETWYTPSATVVHHWLTVDTVTARGETWVLQSQVLFLQKHFSGLKRKAMILTRYLGVVLRLFVYPLVGIFTFEKKRFHQWKCIWVAFWRVLRSRIRYQPGSLKADPWTEEGSLIHE